MKVLHVSNYLYPHIGGIEQTARDIIDSLSPVAEQKAICFNGGKKTVKDSLDGVDVVRCGTLVKISSQAISTGFKKQLKKLFKEFNPDVVVFHYPNPFEARYLLKVLKKHPSCKLVLWWHLDITKQKILGKLFKKQNERLLSMAAKIIATSPNYVEGSPFLKAHKEKCVVIPSCVNEERLKTDETTLKEAEKIKAANDGKTICFAMGRHVEYKGFKYLLEASRLLDDGYKIYLAGEGELTDGLKSLAAGDKKVEFLGRLSDADMKAYMTACDIFCFPSITKNEAFGLALAEAMYYGKPAVTFTIEGSGVNYVSLGGVTGIEAENRNAERYAAAIKELSENKLLRESYGKAAKSRVLENFTLKSFSESVLGLFENI